MKLFVILILVLLTFPNRLFSSDEIDLKPSLKIEFNPLPVFDYTPRYRFGLAYSSSNRMGYSLAFGYGNALLNKWRLAGYSWEKNYSFYEIRPEIQYFFNRNDYFSFYAATELFYLRMNANFENGIYGYSNSSLTVEYDHAHFDKQKYGFHIKGGLRLYARPRIDFDLYAGLGIGYRDIVYSDVINPRMGDKPIFFEWTPQSYLFQGETTMLHLTMGFTVAWQIWGKAK